MQLLAQKKNNPLFYTLVILVVFLAGKSAAQSEVPQASRPAMWMIMANASLSDHFHTYTLGAACMIRERHAIALAGGVVPWPFYGNRKSYHPGASFEYQFHLKKLSAGTFNVYLSAVTDYAYFKIVTGPDPLGPPYQGSFTSHQTATLVGAGISFRPVTSFLLRLSSHIGGYQYNFFKNVFPDQFGIMRELNISGAGFDGPTLRVQASLCYILP